MNYIREKHPELVDLYEEIYNRKINDYWQMLEKLRPNMPPVTAIHIELTTCLMAVRRRASL